MDNSKKAILEYRINRTMENLEKNNMKPYYAHTKEDAVEIVKGLLSEGDVICSGGSVTLKESGVYDLLKSDKYQYFDREGLPNREAVEEVFRKAFSADVYFSSCNAVTENGELYNVDGNSNRVAAICFGPKSVIMLVGYQKLVKNLDEAILRVKSLVAPANCVRLDCDTPCSRTGECISLTKGGNMPSGCMSDRRVCCNYVVSAKQRVKDRIKVIIIGEELGY